MQACLCEAWRIGLYLQHHYLLLAHFWQVKALLVPTQNEKYTTDVTRNPPFIPSGMIEINGMLNNCF